MKRRAIHNNKKHAAIPASPRRRIMRFREFVQSRTAPSLSAPAVHSSLGPNVPGPPNTVATSARPSNFRHRLGEGVAVRSKSVLGGLHHEYSLVPAIV